MQCVLHVDVAQFLGDQWPVPTSKTLGWRVVEDRANALVGRCIVDGRGAGTRQIFEPVQSFAGITTPRHRLTVVGVVSSSRAISRVPNPSAASSTIFILSS